MKENQNELEYNLWSGGEYQNNLNNITCQQDNQKIIISKEWSAIGETSFKITRGGGTGYNWCRIKYNTNNAKQTITATLKVYSPNAQADIWLGDVYSGNDTGHSAVHVYPSEQVQTISLTYTGTLPTIECYAIRVNMVYDNTWLFIDDIQFKY